MKSKIIYKVLVLTATMLTAVSPIYAQVSGKPVLIFQSGFEGKTRIVSSKSFEDDGSPGQLISGNDNSFANKSNWDKDWTPWLKDGAVQIQYTGGDSSKRYAAVINEPGNENNKVLQFRLNDFWLASENQQKARIQANIYGIKGGLKEFYQSVRVFLTPDFNLLKNYSDKITWLTISEFWNNEWWVPTEKHGFRVTLGIGKPVKEPSELYFILEAQDSGFKEIWKADPKSTDVRIPVGKWFTMDYYFKEGDQNTGRFYLAITPEGGKKTVVYDVHGFTHNTSDPSPNGLTGYNPMKLYTSKEVVSFVKSQNKSLQIYWDDFKLWINKQPDQK